MLIGGKGRRRIVLARVAHPLGPVQVAEGRVREAVEQIDRHDRGATDRELALGVARHTAGDEGVVPAQYKDVMAEYYRSLTQEK